jgi:hypothetical protein
MRLRNRPLQSTLSRCLWIALALGGCWSPPAWAGGPRWVTGPPFFSTDGKPVVWYTNQPLYFTDPGDLSANVNHAAADALVAAAASVWNVPTASLVLTQGGALNEHVSGANTFLGPTGLIFPADVQSSNYAAKQIVVIYDSDGSITDLLLGNGASDPTGCLQNGVTESVDSIVPAGFIQHALLVLNGRCTGPAPQQQMQLQYQLMRAFGRVLGLGWSQTNDNVFTGTPPATYNQAMNWPVMHPIDIICGPYTYQCMPQPFTLRPDDLSALAQLYFIAKGQAPAGKTDSLSNATQFAGRYQFPTGQGMQGVNIVARRWQQYTPASAVEDWYTVSSVTGALFRQSNGNPVTGTDPSMNGSWGSTNNGFEGYFNLVRVPMLPGDWQMLVLETEPINPLYTGQYAVGPYPTNTVEPSGPDTPTPYGLFSSYSQAFGIIPAAGSAGTCSSATDGIETSPASVAATGWWNGLLCGYGHTAWSSLSVKGNRSITLEVTAQDEQGLATTEKALPALGIWNAKDAIGSLPSVASEAGAFNGLTTGLTTLTASFTEPAQLRLAIADQRGDGRPDFNYQSRILYADSISPSTVSAAGGAVTISGMGFRTGNAVLIDGVEANVSSWSSNTIVATLPSLHALGATSSLAADVVVEDLSTGGTTTMTQALRYSASSASLTLLTAPTGTVLVGQQAAIPFAVKVLQADGVTPVAGETVTVSATTGVVQFAACGRASCTLSTNAQGIASTSITAEASGAITVQATGLDGTANASFMAIAPLRTATAAMPVEYIAAGSTVSWTPELSITDNTGPTAGTSITWQTISGTVVASPSQTLANAQGVSTTVATAGPLTAGTQAQISGCAWATVCATFSTQGVDPAELQLVAVSGAQQTVPATGALGPVVLLVTDSASHPVAGATVQIHQTVSVWQTACPDRGRCPIAPVLTSSQNSAVSDANGLVTVTPEQLVGVAEVTNLAAATGTSGFLSLSLEKQP